jgi:hypothetical protein
MWWTWPSDERDPVLFVGVQDARRLFDLLALEVAYAGMVVYAGNEESAEIR